LTEPGSVHPAAAVGFDREAGVYARVRPSYPSEVIGVLADAGVDAGARVCDLAAGTGIFTRLLVDAGYDVVAIEPTEGMRTEFVASGIVAELVDGTAEAMPLPDGSVDAVTVAQGFHWFDAPAALAEIHRVLADDGVLMLVWNVRDESADWVRAITDLVHERSGGRPYHDHRDLRWSDVVAGAGGFGPLEEVRFPNPVPSSPEAVVDRVRSTSYVAAMDPEPQRALLDEVAELIATHPDTAGRERFEYPHDTGRRGCCVGGAGAAPTCRGDRPVTRGRSS
jgi:SAM-dependent methyltransferase